ncbi:hypothetical protein VPJ68_06805, partial [Parabacteroides distasonis]
MIMDLFVLKKIKEGDIKAFESIFRPYYTPLCLYAKMSQSFFPQLFAWTIPLMGGDLMARQIHHFLMWFFFLVRYVFLDKLPATDDGRSLATLLDIVMIKYQINMNDSEKDEEPHQ